MSPAIAYAPRFVPPTDVGLDLVPEIVLPSQFDDLRRNAEGRPPEHRLMLAVLEDAVYSYQQGVKSRATRDRRLFNETEEWFESEETTSPFSFVTICQVFGLDPDYLRAGLRRWRAGCESEVQAGSRTIPFRIRRVSGSRHRVGLKRQRSA